MRAVRIHRYGPPEVLELERDVPEPEVGDDDVLIEVHAAAVNPVDTKIRAGAQRAVIRLSLPAILGMDVSGVVLRVGRAVTTFREGDEVFASPSHQRQGGYAERVSVRASEIAHKPTELTHAEAASLPLVALTAWDALVRVGQLAPGQRVLIQAGAGGVGSIAIQLAKHLGAEVYATCSERNVAFVRSLGCDVAIDYGKERYEDVAQGVDLVVESLAGEHFARALETVRRGGRIVALTTGLPEAAKRYGAWLGAAATAGRLGGLVLGSRMRHGVRFSPIARRADGAVLAQIADLVSAGAIRPIVEDLLPLARAADAHRVLEAGRVRGKLVLDTRPEADSTSAPVS